ncbi:MAG: hypothetical protein IJJ23_07405 [Clostridia bacterium]|nr:hypothetical protein [Clostridia bacterium]
MTKITRAAAAAALVLALALSLDGCGQTAKKAPQDGETAQTVDVDLTTLSSTMVYAEVFNMVNSPQDYIGRTVKMKGSCNTVFDDVTEKDYYTCIIQDATACCETGIEFVLSEGQTYPSEMDEITVMGTFDTYEEGPYTYCTLREATLLELTPWQGKTEVTGDLYG